MARKRDARGRSGPRIGVAADAGFLWSRFVRHRLATHGGEVLNAEAQIVGSSQRRALTVTGQDSVGGRNV
jgi:hypothetical protein